METMGDFGLEFIKVLGYLAVVLLMVLAALYGLKRLGRWAQRPGVGTWIEVLAQHPVGFKHYLLLIKVQEQMFLLGVSPQGMHFLSSVQSPSAPPAAEDLKS